MERNKHDQVLVATDAVAAVCVLTWLFLFLLIAHHQQPAQQSPRLPYFFVDSVFVFLAIPWLVGRYAKRFNRIRSILWSKSNRGTIAAAILAGLLINYILFKATGGY